jgi:hypothetical protein
MGPILIQEALPSGIISLREEFHQIQREASYLGFVVALVQGLPGSALHHPAQPVIALTSCSRALLLKAEKNHNPAPVC